MSEATRKPCKHCGGIYPAGHFPQECRETVKKQRDAAQVAAIELRAELADAKQAFELERAAHRATATLARCRDEELGAREADIADLTQQNEALASVLERRKGERQMKGLGTTYFHEALKRRGANLSAWIVELSVRTQEGLHDERLTVLISETRKECSALLQTLTEVSQALAEKGDSAGT